MSNKITDINIKSHTYLFFNDISNIENFDPDNIKIDEKSYKNTIIYYIGYITIKDLKYVKISSANNFLSTKLMDILKKLIKVSI